VSLSFLRRRAWGRLAVALALLLSAGAIAQGHAAAAPKQTVEQVRQEVDALRQQAEAAAEKYNGLKEQIASLNVQLEAAQIKLAEERKAVAAAQLALGQVAVETYKAGDMATLSLFFGDNPDKIVNANGLLISLGDRKSEAVTDLLKRQQALVAGMTDVQERQQKLQQAQKDLQVARAAVLKKLADANAMLDQLTAGERNQLGQLQTRSDKAGLAGLGITVPASGKVTCGDVPMGSVSQRVKTVLDYACGRLGDPYQWAGAGPSTYDCSGLTMMAWKAAGVSLPHNAAMQAGYGTRVPLNQIQPGDLVFFRNPIGHVGIALGNGLMVHAPQTGDVVKIAPYHADLVAAVRL
jgi:cell wall-associated NlpC family hydrolase